MKKREVFMSDDGESALFEIDWKEGKVITRCEDPWYDYFISFEDIGRLYGRIAEGIGEKMIDSMKRKKEDI
jgi:hypothetical protein